METPTKIAIEQTIAEHGPMTAGEILSRSGLSSTLLYMTIMTMEEDGDILFEEASDPSGRIYRLPARRAA